MAAGEDWRRTWSSCGNSKRNGTAETSKCWTTQQEGGSGQHKVIGAGAEGGGGRQFMVVELRTWSGGEEISWHHIHNFEKSINSQLSRKKTQMNLK
jgi:hypothetical protein